MQIFFRTSMLQSEIFARIQRKSMLAPLKKFTITQENQTCTDDCLGCGMLSSLAVFRRLQAKRNCNMHMFSKPWSGEDRARYIGCWLDSGLVMIEREVYWLLDFLWFWCENFHTMSWFGDKTPGGIIVSVRWQTLAFYLLSPIACLLKEMVIHDTMIGRCNGILIVPMCLWILFWLNKKNRLSLIERFIIRVICTSRLSLMLRSFRCSLVKIFWGFIVFRVC